MEKIELTPQELIDIKDEIKFRTKVIMQLKALNGTPKKVTVLETKVALQFWFIGIIITGVGYLIVRVVIMP